MNIGNFFEAAPAAKPVVPKQVKFKAACRDLILPGGAKNPHPGSTVTAECVACLVFVSADELTEANIDARDSITKRAGKRPFTELDVYQEVVHQVLFRAVREWDPDEELVGGSFFGTIEAQRKMLSGPQTKMLIDQFNAYMIEEHAEAPTDETFRDAEGAGAEAPSGTTG